MHVIARRSEQQYHAPNKGVGKKLLPLHEELFGWAGKALYPLFGAVGFVLLIACVNVANLMQFRTDTRRKEYALRVSLGAGRRRLTQQVLTESGLLALVAGALGVLLALGGIPIFRALAGAVPDSESLTIDRRVLLFTLGIWLLPGSPVGLRAARQT